VGLVREISDLVEDGDALVSIGTRRQGFSSISPHARTGMIVMGRAVTWVSRRAVEGQ
jgi:hypothetical protein